MATRGGVITPQTDAAPMYETQSAFGEDTWSGWLVFAGIVLMVEGVMRVFDGIWAFSYHGKLPENLQNALIGQDLNRYGWLWLFVGIVLFLCGCAVMIRSQVARWIGVAGGALAAISAIWWMPYYPVWSFLYIALGVLVVYALVAHGGRAQAR